MSTPPSSKRFLATQAGQAANPVQAGQAVQAANPVQANDTSIKHWRVAFDKYNLVAFKRLIPNAQVMHGIVDEVLNYPKYTYLKENPSQVGNRKEFLDYIDKLIDEGLSWMDAIEKTRINVDEKTQLDSSTFS